MDRKSELQSSFATKKGTFTGVLPKYMNWKSWRWGIFFLYNGLADGQLVIYRVASLLKS